MQLTDWIGALTGIVGVLVAIGALRVAARANFRSKEANRIAQTALDIESRVDDRQREFRAVEWDAGVAAEDSGQTFRFELRNAGDTDAIGATVVLQLTPDRETHQLGNIPAKNVAVITSDSLDNWMREAVVHEVVHPAYRVHWSSPLGQVSDITMPARTVDDFIVDFGDDY